MPMWDFCQDCISTICSDGDACVCFEAQVNLLCMGSCKMISFSDLALEMPLCAFSETEDLMLLLVIFRIIKPRMTFLQCGHLRNHSCKSYLWSLRPRVNLEETPLQW